MRVAELLRAKSSEYELRAGTQAVPSGLWLKWAMDPHVDCTTAKDVDLFPISIHATEAPCGGFGA